MKIILYLFLATLLLLFAYIVFRRIVRRDYQSRGRLSPFASALQFLVFLGFFMFPYLFNPSEWVWFWRVSDSIWQLIGFILICLGILVAFGTMAWFGAGKAFGVNVSGLTTSGPYRYSRNPQVLGGYLLVIGTALQWPSLYSFGWIILYAIIVHWMVITEEEHLFRVYGDRYEAYCLAAPRYLFKSKTVVENSA